MRLDGMSSGDITGGTGIERLARGPHGKTQPSSATCLGHTPPAALPEPAF